MNFKNKKIALSILLVSIVLIIFTIILKENKRYSLYDDFGAYIGYKVKNVIFILDVELSYNNTLFFLFISLIISILVLMFFDDGDIKKGLKEFIRRFTNIKKYETDLWGFIKRTKKIIFISILLLAFILLYKAKCNKQRKVVKSETYIDNATIDTTLFIDTVKASTMTQKEKLKDNSIISTKNNSIKKENTNNLSKGIDSFSPEAIAKAANSTPLGKSISRAQERNPGTKGSPASSGLDDDQLQNSFGSGGTTLDAAAVSAASSLKSNRKKR
jgi:hypothetical protein